MIYHLPDHEQMKQLGWRALSNRYDSYLSQDACRRLQFDVEMETVYLQQRSCLTTAWCLRAAFRYIDPPKDLLPLLQALHFTA